MFGFRRGTEMKKYFLAAVLSCAGLCSPVGAETTPSQQTASFYDVSKFDIVGVKIGMRPGEVLRILKNSGFDAKPGFSETEFARVVRDKAWSLNQPVPNIDVERGPSYLSGYDAQRNHVMVSFIGLATGPEVVSVTLKFNSETNQTERLKEQIAGKYGRPSTVEQSSWTNVWCAAGDGACGNPFREDSRVFYHYWFSGNEITLVNYGPAKRLLETQISSYFSNPTDVRQKSLVSSK